MKLLLMESNTVSQVSRAGEQFQFVHIQDWCVYMRCIFEAVRQAEQGL